MPRKHASQNVVCLCHLLNILENFSNLFLHTGKLCGPWSDCSWSGSTLFAKNDFLNHKQMTKQTTTVVTGSLRVKAWVIIAADNILKILIFIVQSKSDSIFHVNCLLDRGFTSNIKTYFLWKNNNNNKKKKQINDALPILILKKPIKTAAQHFFFFFFFIFQRK